MITAQMTARTRQPKARAALVLLSAAALMTASCARGESGVTNSTSPKRLVVSPSNQPSPSPPYRVGSVVFDLVDHSRSTPSNGKAPGKPYRDLPTLVLYPAKGSPSAHVFQGAQPEKQGGPFALIVFAHGYGSDGAQYAPLLAQWAQAGFVVAAPTFPLSSGSAAGGPSLVDYEAQPGDLSFVLARVLALSRMHTGPLAGMIDPHKIAGVGHSLGAMTVLAWTEDTCCLDPLVDAAVVFDGVQAPFGKGSYFAGRTVPLLVLHGTADRTLPYSGGQTIYANAKPPKFFISLIGAPHTSFLQSFDQSLKTPVWEHVDVQSVVDFLLLELDHRKSAQNSLDETATDPGVAKMEQIP